jgi:uncharacterized membrane protein
MILDPIVIIHLAAALLALALGVVNIFGAKGTPRHRAIGWIWMAMMLGVTLPSFGIAEINPGGFSWIHGLSILTLVTMLASIWAIRAKRVRAHKQMMISLVVSLTIAGIFTLMPGRVLGTIMGFGDG